MIDGESLWEGLFIGFLFGALFASGLWFHNLQGIISRNRKTYEDLMRKYQA